MRTSLSVRYVDRLGVALVDKMLGEVIHQTPVEILVHIAEAVTLCWQIEHIETLVGANQSIHHARGVTWVYVVVNLAVYQHQMTLQVACNLWVALDAVKECCVALVIHLLLHAVVSLAPPAVVNLIIVVTCARYRRLEEVRVLQHSRS